MHENKIVSFTTIMTKTSQLFYERVHLENWEREFGYGVTTQNFQIKFYATMYDEKLERKAACLTGCSFEYIMYTS